MKRRTWISLTAALSAATLSFSLMHASAGSAGAPTATASSTTPVASSDAQTQKIVSAANAFLGALNATQRQSVLFAFTDSAQRQRWSNLPTGLFQRAGLRWGDLNAAQRAALTTLLGAVLSPDGLKMVQQQMAADDILKAESASGTQGGAGQAPTTPTGQGQRPAGGTPPGGQAGGPGGSLIFGSDEYYVSFLGTPSTSGTWTLQFGGHHLAINATVAGKNVTLSPSLTGGQPIRSTSGGKTTTVIDKVPQEIRDAGALLGSLSAAQKAKAIISGQSIDLVLGPGQDGRTLQPEGLSASAMTAAQQAALLKLIQDRLGILNADDLNAKMTEIRRNLAQTTFAWYGPTNGSAAYYRVTAPTAIIEFSPQSMGGDATNHLHNMYRDPSNDYGAAWTK
ncbi:DUF3500 domain-containing protein [Deinococcus depolymerans]|uniref:DUF3500 domain-containing protein n=1 Tax=Deinococcus depolymerans TaxID=392408 RepID=A0ABN1CJ43_9DEIO